MPKEPISYWANIQSFTKNLVLTENLKEDGSEYFKKNSLGFRCDEFKKTHNEKHILFSGCSSTYGVGLKKEEVWSYKTYNEIKKLIDCSGYFNIAIGGNSIYRIILDIFKYCNNFGNPDIIFINLPDQYRFFDFDYKEKEYKQIKYNDKKFFNFIKLLNYDIYTMLEQYCNSNNIKLFSFSWSILDDDSTNEVFKNYNFETFYYINEKELFNKMVFLKEKNDSIFFEKARDDKHYGTGYHIFWNNFIFEKYVNLTKNI